MLTLLYYVQIVLSITLVVIVLLQVKSASLGGAFGASDASIFATRRGFDRILFNFTIILSTIFVLTSVVTLLVTRSS